MTVPGASEEALSCGGPKPMVGSLSTLSDCFSFQTRHRSVMECLLSGKRSRYGCELDVLSVPPAQIPFGQQQLSQ